MQPGKRKKVDVMTLEVLSKPRIRTSALHKEQEGDPALPGHSRGGWLKGFQMLAIEARTSFFGN